MPQKTEFLNSKSAKQQAYIVICSQIFKFSPNTTEEITGDQQFEFWHNRLTTDPIFCICQILHKYWEYNEAMHQLFLLT